MPAQRLSSCDTRSRHVTRWLLLDADWNARFPFGASACLRLGRSSKPGRPDVPGLTLDVNAPLGEPNRLYLWGRSWAAIVSLPQLRAVRLTGEVVGVTPVYEDCLAWPHLDGPLLTIVRMGHGGAA